MRVRRAKLVLPAIAGALALLLIVEGLLPSTSAPPLPSLAIPTAIPAAGDGAAIGQWADTILARPIFNQDRRPAAVAGNNTDSPPPRLCAIIIVGGSRRAIFAAPGAKPIVVGPGGEVGGYQVKTITASNVALLGPDGGISTLRLQYFASAVIDVANSGQ